MVTKTITLLAARGRMVNPIISRSAPALPAFVRFVSSLLIVRVCARVRARVFKVHFIPHSSFLKTICHH